MIADDTAIFAAKAKLRKTMLRRRAAITSRDAAQVAINLTANAQHLKLPAGAIIAAYWPLPGELNVKPLMMQLQAFGHPIVLPRMQSRDRPLTFHLWRLNDRLHNPPGMTVSRIREPAADAPSLRPDMLLVPLLAFDDEGWRLGFGGGYYDRSLAALRGDGEPVRAIGLAYARQQVDSVPHAAYDARLDAVLTENGLLTI